ncbi:Heavy metal-associated domain, HMA [Spirosomataceae bacterium]|jgi:copper chaperone CopZ
MKFKSNINCQNCVAKVKNTLDTLVGTDAWKVDTENPAKILDITNPNTSASEVVNKLKRIGFTAELID